MTSSLLHPSLTLLTRALPTGFLSTAVLSIALSGTLLGAPQLGAQIPGPAAVVVDFDDSALGTAQIAAPFYTPGAGAAGLTVRQQLFCPSSFPGLPGERMRCTRVGFQLAGSGLYDRFDLRAGATSVPALTDTFAANLPDQTVQFDGSFVPFAFGASAQWVEFPLGQPFDYLPGDSVVVDLTTRLAPSSIGTTLETVPTTTESGRLVEFDYQGLPTAAGGPRSTGGIRFRLVFEPLNAPVPFGSGCAGSGVSTVTLSGLGLATPGGSLSIEVDEADPVSPILMFVGLSDQAGPFGPLPFSFGGGCELLVSTEVGLTLAADPSGHASLPVQAPSLATLVGANFYFQAAQISFASPAAVFPLVFSNGLRVEFR